jgi:catechol 2,3-dioxygenase-like lactoylglutathione lyase family enzyme
MKPIGLVPEFLVTDLKKSLNFYVGLLGFTVLYSREEKFVYIKKDNAEIMLEQIGIGRNWVTKDLEYPLGRGTNFQIEVEDVDLLHKILSKNSIPIFLQMEEKWYRKNNLEVGNRQFCVQDPDGYLLRFYKDLGEKNVQDS